MNLHTKTGGPSPPVRTTGTSERLLNDTHDTSESASSASQSPERQLSVFFDGTGSRIVAPDGNKLWLSYLADIFRRTEGIGELRQSDAHLPRLSKWWNELGVLADREGIAAAIAQPWSHRKIYFHGIGTSTKVGIGPTNVAPLSAMTGHEVSEGVIRGYKWLSTVYRFLAKKDRIFIFGWSRGAAQALILAGALARLGLPYSEGYKAGCSLSSPKDWENVEKVLKRGFHKDKERDCYEPVQVQFVGLFEAILAEHTPKGMKADWMGRYVNLPRNYSSNIKSIYHALALNESLPDVHNVWFNCDHEFDEVSFEWLLNSAVHVGGLRLRSKTDYADVHHFDRWDMYTVLKHISGLYNKVEDSWRPAVRCAWRRDTNLALHESVITQLETRSFTPKPICCTPKLFNQLVTAGRVICERTPTKENPTSECDAPREDYPNLPDRKDCVQLSTKHPKAFGNQCGEAKDTIEMAKGDRPKVCTFREAAGNWFKHPKVADME
ncbi:unnamed protein product [Vitrella brassicaformis CCMP3155]|uniref:T6SS Phospholipase effector Tle1-like catalytic domain-containing protein n=1 Tax=Vitrella brassicaformis (strain CCMP3155) TaxID=1169540 RepID=A0A0G4EGD0_VITBC|nr:unnamed protein product [Vitrella brassicaformis CCMP3155]|eukprot:CEL94528.1 unnamed protein product [Vitrella brassicaformis CCMP3155]